MENFSPRVVEQFGLDYESLVALKPDVIFVRMPGFGLHGPWRDYVGWALNFEQTAGMSAVTGYPDGPPCNPQGPADPIVGVHAGVALLAALEHRRRTGEGRLIEVAQIEVAACVTAEPVIEYSPNGVVSQREGNRRRGYLQGVYPTNEEGVWVALSVPGDSDAVDHDVFDKMVAAWTRTQTADVIVDTLRTQGIPAERVITGEQMYDIPPTRRATLLRGIRASRQRSAPLSGLAVSHRTRAGAAPPQRRAHAGSTQRRDPARTGPFR